MWATNTPVNVPSLPINEGLWCPRDATHEGTLTTLDGAVRCAHVRNYTAPLYPHFELKYDPLAELAKKVSCGPPEHKYSDEPEKLEYVQYADACYAIIRDPQRVISLERVLRRLNRRQHFHWGYERMNTPANKRKTTPVEFRMDLIELSFLVSEWYTQSPRYAPLFIRDERPRKIA